MRLSRREWQDGVEWGAKEVAALRYHFVTTTAGPLQLSGNGCSRLMHF